MMQLVADIRHRYGVENCRIGFRGRVDVDHRQRIVGLARGIESRDVSHRLGRRLHRHAGRSVEAWIGFPIGHWDTPTAGRLDFRSLKSMAVPCGRCRNYAPQAPRGPEAATRLCEYPAGPASLPCSTTVIYQCDAETFISADPTEKSVTVFPDQSLPARLYLEQSFFET